MDVYLQCKVIEGRLPAARPLQEVVNNVLLLAVPQVSVVRLHLERAAEQRGARHVASAQVGLLLFGPLGLVTC